jgi:hypothetical protein
MGTEGDNPTVYPATTAAAMGTVLPTEQQHSVQTGKPQRSVQEPVQQKEIEEGSEQEDIRRKEGRRNQEDFQDVPVVFEEDERDKQGKEILLGGRLLAFVDRWDKIKGGKLIRNGLWNDWDDGPPPNNIRLAKQRQFRGKEEEEMVNQIQEELEEGVIEEVKKEEVLFVNEVGLVRKRGGKLRKILKAQGLNAFLRKKKFKMEGPKQAAEILRRGDYAVTLDMTKAYHHVPVNPNLRSYLAFTFHGKYFRYLGTPFGVSTAPRVFSRIMHHCAALVRVKWNIRCIQYLDDWMLLSADAKRLEEVTPEIIQFLRRVGWTINEEKCVLVPRRKFEFLGWKWDSMSLSVKLPERKRRTLIAMVKRWIVFCMQIRKVPVRQLAAMIGKLSATRFQFHQASAYLAHLYALQSKYVKEVGWEGSVRLSRWVLKDLLWWREKIAQNRETPLHHPQFQASLFTDASPWGFGAVLQIEDQEYWRNGVWNQHERDWTSNRKELVAIERALRMYHPLMEEKQISSILIRSDNSAAVFNTNRKRACLSLLEPLRKLLNYVAHKRIHVEARHIPGVNNSKADRLSRICPSGDYSIKDEVLKPALKKMRFQMTADLFASKGNAKSRIFCSLGQTKRALAVDALTISWRGMKPLLHPPIPLLSRVLRKVEEEEIEAAVLAPLWHGQVWSPVLERLTLKRLDLGESKKILIRGKKMMKTGAFLPPGRLGMFIVKGQTNQVKNSLSQF